MLTQKVDDKICLAKGVTAEKAVGHLYQIEYSASNVFEDVCDNICVHVQTAQSQAELDAKCVKCSLEKLRKLISC